jgi:hypothetical protein
MRTFVVVLLAARNPYDGEGGLRVVQAETAEAAVRAAHPRPPSTMKVRWAWAAELADPYAPTMVPVDVPEPEWGKPKPAPRRPGQ